MKKIIEGYIYKDYSINRLVQERGEDWELREISIFKTQEADWNKKIRITIEEIK